MTEGNETSLRVIST